MSEKFKGKSGGDPSRRPPLVKVSFHCVVCNKSGSAETKRPAHFQAPKTCSTVCASNLVRQEAEHLISSVLGESNTPQAGSISQRMAEEILAAHNWMVRAELGDVRKVAVICAHCGNSAENFTTTTHPSNKQVSKFCSWECKTSNNEGLPAGVVCRSPKKAAHSTLEEAQVAAANISAQLLLAGDSEGVTPYLCSCERWHVGHNSKNVWLEPVKATVAFLTERTLTLVQQRKSIRRTNQK